MSFITLTLSNYFFIMIFMFWCARNVSVTFSGVYYNLCREKKANNKPTCCVLSTPAPGKFAFSLVSCVCDVAAMQGGRITRLFAC